MSNSIHDKCHNTVDTDKATREADNSWKKNIIIHSLSRYNNK